jgi:class 3 adenylate cyclase
LVANNTFQDISAITFGFGIVSGPMIEGNIGSSIKMDYTVLGDTVDEAIHLAAFARDKHQAIAIEESIQPSADPSWDFEDAGEFEFSNLNKPIRIHTLSNFEPRKAKEPCPMTHEPERCAVFPL